ncbi:TetR/AcrR family transcriptional regulator [Corynebacterium sp. p3-SID1056]|uniref:TetR/AcrR family transcriptional regulator n=1 Tax=Corynebacterium sp. p3-SID1056 TaxID=2916092 RepID=UPI0021A96CFF|nr:TetR/AcrR family transcriptional regulator [Corynebacterium sp. p3-SID1056]MCT2338152.1 TetR/AcrR family transcriptional regulator [Corynebacterium sp. p3-SID1056]
MRSDARAKREKIITAATEQFRTRPNSAVTLEAVAKDAGVGIATLYRHFPSRAALRQACALRFIEELDVLLDDTLTNFSADPEGNWERFIWQLVDAGVGILVGALAPEHPVGTERLDEFFRHVQVLLDTAAPHGLIARDATPGELASELIVVTRPMDETLTALFPDVRERLVRHLLSAWRASA